MLPFPYTNALQSKQQAHIGSRSTIVRLYLRLYLSHISYLQLYRRDKHLILFLFNDVSITQRHLLT